MRVTGADVPPLLSSQQAAEQIDQQLRVNLGDDILNAYVSAAPEGSGRHDPRDGGSHGGRRRKLKHDVGGDICSGHDPAVLRSVFARL